MTIVNPGRLRFFALQACPGDNSRHQHEPALQHVLTHATALHISHMRLLRHAPTCEVTILVTPAARLKPHGYPGVLGGQEKGAPTSLKKPTWKVSPTSTYIDRSSPGVCCAALARR